MASSFAAVAAAVGPELTACAVVVFPVRWAPWSTTVASATASRPEYSLTATPMSALEVVVAVIVGRVPPPAVTGALQTVSSVFSDAANRVSSE